jgi:hypothetical protein
VGARGRPPSCYWPRTLRLHVAGLVTTSTRRQATFEGSRRPRRTARVGASRRWASHRRPHAVLCKSTQLFGKGSSSPLTTHTTNAYHTTCHLPHPPATTTTSPLSRDGAGGASGRQTSGHGDKGRGGWCKAGPASRHRDCPIARVGLRPLAQPVMLMDRPLPRRPEGGCS